MNQSGRKKRVLAVLVATGIMVGALATAIIQDMHRCHIWVWYEGLQSGKEYLLRGTVVDANTGNTFLVDGKPMTSETRFTSEKGRGLADIVFPSSVRISWEDKAVTYELFIRENGKFTEVVPAIYSDRMVSRQKQWV